MKVILIHDVSNLGKKGEVKEVSAGYASNLLIPKKLAILATPVEMENLKKRAEIEKQKKDKETAALKELAEKAKLLNLEIEEKADENGTLYGGVDKKKIAEILKNKGIDISPEKIELFSHLKKIGEHQVTVNFLPEIKVKVKINIKASA